MDINDPDVNARVKDPPQGPHTIDGWDKDWPSETALVYPAVGCKLLKKQQSSMIQEVLMETDKIVLYSTCFEDAFPNVSQWVTYVHDVLISATHRLQFKMIENRLTKDIKYRQILSAVVSFVIQVQIFSVLKPFRSKRVCVSGMER